MHRSRFSYIDIKTRVKCKIKCFKCTLKILAQFASVMYWKWQKLQMQRALKLHLQEHQQSTWKQACRFQGSRWVEGHSEWTPTVSHTSFLIFSLYVWEENTARLSDGLCHIQIINLCFSHLIQSLLTHTYTWFTLLFAWDGPAVGYQLWLMWAHFSSILMHRTHLIYSFILHGKYQRWLQISESLCSARWQWEGRNLHQIQTREKQLRGKRSTKKSRNTNETKLNSS